LSSPLGGVRGGLTMKDNLPIILFETEQDWIHWLEENENESGVWMQIAKKNSRIISISYQQALDVALCFGWIDGVKNRFDEKTWVQRFTPRKPNSKWSKINRNKAEELIAGGKMRPSGMAAIELAKQKGIWDTAYDSQKNATIPVDLQNELDKNPEAAAFFNSLNSVNRYAIIYRLRVSRNPEIRTKKLAGFIEMLNKNEKIHN
jgi:uncharacterized protein YdeI (YjbR/CyaY-like superfamily)